MTPQTPTGELPPLTLVPRMSSAEVDQLAADAVTGRRYVAVFGSPGWASFESWFHLLVGGMEAKGYSHAEFEAWIDPLGGAWESLRNAGPSPVPGGFPMFVSGHLIRRDDLELIAKAMDRHIAALQASGGGRS